MSLDFCTVYHFAAIHRDKFLVLYMCDRFSAKKGLRWRAGRERATSELLIREDIIIINILLVLLDHAEPIKILFNLNTCFSSMLSRAN